jgi:hypothetical protein
VNLPLSDLLDRYSIELRKDCYGHGNRHLIESLQAEIRTYLSDRSKNHLPQDVYAMIDAAVRLGLANADIANLEWQLRAHDPKITMEEHGRRAIAIRAINDKRNAAKADLSKDLGENVDTKHYGYGDLIQAEQITADVQQPISLISDQIKTLRRLQELQHAPFVQEPIPAHDAVASPKSDQLTEGPVRFSHNQ